jgi:hypothetical protein
MTIEKIAGFPQQCLVGPINQNLLIVLVSQSGSGPLPLLLVLRILSVKGRNPLNKIKIGFPASWITRLKTLMRSL